MLFVGRSHCATYYVCAHMQHCVNRLNHELSIATSSLSNRLGFFFLTLLKEHTVCSHLLRSESEPDWCRNRALVAADRRTWVMAQADLASQQKLSESSFSSFTHIITHATRICLCRAHLVFLFCSKSSVMSDRTNKGSPVYSAWCCSSSLWRDDSPQHILNL